MSTEADRIKNNMLKVIRTWGGNFTITSDHLEYWYGTIGSAERNSKCIMCGPAETEEEIIRNGYKTIYQKLWVEVNWVINR